MKKVQFTAHGDDEAMEVAKTKLTTVIMLSHDSENPDEWEAMGV